MYVTNNRAQNRNVHFNYNGLPQSVPVKAFETLNIPLITSMSQVIFNAEDAHLREVNMSVNNNNSLQTFTLLPAKNFVTSFTFSATLGGPSI
jgi:gentisate 1,2-dioxygenase